MRKSKAFSIIILIFFLCATSVFSALADAPIVAYKGDSGSFFSIESIKNSLMNSPEDTIDYPMLAPGESWYAGSTKRSTITDINITDSASKFTVMLADECWSAGADQNGDGALDDSVMCYVNGTTLTIAGNGSGKIYMNPDSKFAFSTMEDDEFSNLATISDTSLLDTSKVVEMKGMFWGCANLKTLDLSSWNTSNVTDMYSVFNTCSKLENLDLSAWDTSNVITMRAMFNTCSSLKELDLSAWDTSALESTFGMFNKCTSLEKINLDGWNTSNITTMSSMFQLCENLTEIKGLEDFNTKNVNDLSFMFYQCPKLKTLDLRHFDTSKVTNFDHIFCHSAITLEGGKDAVKNWDTSSAENMNAMFYQIQNPVLDVSHFDTSNVKVFSQMFEGCAMEEIIGLENFDTSNGITFHEMFWNAYNLKEVNLSNFDTRKAKNGVKISTNNTYSYTMKGFFGGENAGNPSLEKIILGENFSFNGDGTNTNENYKFKMPLESSVGTSTYWETPDGKLYAPAEVPEKTAGIYTARGYKKPIIVLENAVYSEGEKSIDVTVSLSEEMQEKNGKVLITAYRGDKMLDIYYQDASPTVTHTFENVSPAENYTVKVFYWSDFGKIIPLCNSVLKEIQ